MPALALYPTPSTAAAATRTDAAAIQATSGGRHRRARQEAATARGELTLTPLPDKPSSKPIALTLTPTHTLWRSASS